MSADFGIGAALARIRPGHPLVIADADEVLLRFVDGFDRFLRRQALFLDLTSYRLHGNVKRIDDLSPVLDVEVTALLEEFRDDLDSLELVEGAREALTALSGLADVVVLTNITPAQAVPRARNFAALGFDFPLIANTGRKGPNVRLLADRAAAPTFFIDDIGSHLASAAECAPDVLRIHLIGDERLKGLMPDVAHADFRAENWHEAADFIRERLGKAIF